MKDKSKDFKNLEVAAPVVTLTAPMIYGFVETFLLDTFDDAVAIPKFHMDLWNLECTDAKLIAAAAPRGHGKSTAGDYCFVLANVLFGVKSFVLLVGATEDLVKPHLRNIRDQLANNEDLIEAFDVKILKDNETELMFTVMGRPVLMLARGAEQRLRGLNWNNKRPDLVMCDDMEDDETVMSKDRRDKFQKWFESAVLPIGSRKVKIIVLGTILHEGSLLENLLNNDSWASRRFRAHADFDDFTEILWPEYHTERTLKEIRQSYINSGNDSGYSQEYLSSPIAESDSYFRKDMLVPMADEDYKSPKLYYIAVDFAITKSEKSDYTVMSVGGVDSNGMLHIVDQRVFKGDGIEIIDTIFELEEQYQPEFWVFENGQIKQSLGAFLNRDMRERGVYISIKSVTPKKDKMTRARSIQKRLQAGGVRFNKEDSFYAPLEHEMLMFPRGKHDDRVDTLAYLGLYLDYMIDSPTLNELEEAEELEEIRESGLLEEGRCQSTGY